LNSLTRANRGVARQRALVQIGLVQMPVVHVQATGFDSGQRRDQPVQFERLRARLDSGAVHAAVDVEQHHKGFAQAVATDSSERFLITPASSAIVEKFPARKCHVQLDQPLRARARGLVREQNVVRAGRRRHLRLGDGRAFEFGDPASTCMRRTSGSLCVLMCGRSRAGSPTQAIMRRIFRRRDRRKSAGRANRFRRCSRRDTRVFHPRDVNRYRKTGQARWGRRRLCVCIVKL